MKHEHSKRRIYPILRGTQLAKIDTLQIVDLIDGMQKKGKRLEDMESHHDKPR
ncbi:hypothetical protein [Listeria booriae]|uniref:hypothetical protein n=1 Tax=Listeria booriae TaxID=1552123 RepID=UPI0021AD89F0|nr:hypothetical protein [Listeria booriae]